MLTGKRGKGISRRQFVKRSALLAAPLILPASVFGSDGAKAPSGRVALGLIGSGGRGTGVMKAMLSRPEAEVVAVCDVRDKMRERAAGVVAKHKANKKAGKVSGKGKPCDMYGDFRELLERDDIDAVLIAPQDHWHAPIAVAAAAAGKDMYCEKPLGVAVTESRAICEAVRRYGRVFQTGTQQRSDAKFRQACNLAHFGHLGKVHTVEVAAPGPKYQPRFKGPFTAQPVPKGFDYNMYVGPAPFKPYNPCCIDWPGWYLIKDYCAGFIVNWGVHHLDIANWGMPSIGKTPFKVTCKSTYRTHPICDNINSWQSEFVFDDGLVMKFSDTGNPLPQGTRFIGEKGWVHVNRGGIKAEPASLLDVRVNDGLYESTHHQGNFLECVLDRKDPVAPVEAGHVATILGMIAEISGRLEHELRWDPVAQQFVDDAEANRLLTRPMRGPWRV